MENPHTQPFAYVPNSSPPPPKKSKLGRNIIIAGLILLTLIILMPVGVIGSFFISCSIKMHELDTQTSTVRSKLKKITDSRPDIKASAYTNGDCLTGSGTGFTIETNKSYRSFNAAEQDMNNLVRLQELTVPTKEIEFFNGVDGSSSGGDTDIQTIQYSRPLNNYASYGYEFHLQTKITCKNVAKMSFCANIPREKAETPEYMSNKPVTSATMNGNIRHEAYMIKN